MIDWLRRKLHLGPDHENIKRSNDLSDETCRNIRRLKAEEAALGRELAAMPDDPLAQALVTARKRAEEAMLREALERDGPARAIRESRRRIEVGN